MLVKSLRFERLPIIMMMLLLLQRYSTTPISTATAAAWTTTTTAIRRETSSRLKKSSSIRTATLFSPSRLFLSSSSSSSSSLPSSVRSSSTSTTSSTTSDNSNNRIQLANRLNGLDQPTVWQEFSPLAVEYKSVNLGQGFPDWEPPLFVKQCFHDAIYNDHVNQYARSYAHMPLAIQLATDYSERLRIPINPESMIATAVGCTNVLFCALHGLLNPNDEVICFEPAFDIYTSQVRLAGGIPIFVPLRDSETVYGSSKTSSSSSSSSSSSNDHANANDKFVIDMSELENAITEKTKVILLNTPHNPTGKVFSRTELQQIANIVQKYPQITIISDEVYEHIIFQDEENPTMEHISIASLPNMFDKTLTLSSSGKTFSCTGWKVGWAVGPAHLIKSVTAMQQWVNYSTPTPNQHAIAKALHQAQQEYKHPDDGIVYKNYYTWLVSEYQRKRGLLVSALQAAGMKPIIPQGGFFIMAETSNIHFPYTEQYQYQITDAMPKQEIIVHDDDNNEKRRIIMPRDWALSRWLTETVGVTAIPPSAFYCLDRVSLAKNYLRFAFCKSDDTILQAQERFEKYFF